MIRKIHLVIYFLIYYKNQLAQDDSAIIIEEFLDFK